MDPRTAEALYSLQVALFLEGMSDFVPEPAEYGLTQERADEIRDEAVLDEMSRTDWNEVAA